MPRSLRTERMLQFSTVAPHPLRSATAATVRLPPASGKRGGDRMPHWGVPRVIRCQRPHVLATTVSADVGGTARVKASNHALAREQGSRLAID